MLGDWYYCCCVGATPLSTRTTLSILSTLAVETDEQLVRAAYEEMPRCDAWTQIYGLAHVLAAMGRIAPAGRESRQLHAYFDHIVECAPDQQRDQLLQLFDALDSNGRLRDLTALIAAARSSLEGETRPVSPVPYLDLTALVRETVVAAMIAAQVEDPALRHGKLHDHLQRDDSPLRRFCQEALDEGAYGRLATRLVARVAVRAMGVSVSQIIASLSQSGRPTFEPDLLDTIIDAQANAWAREPAPEVAGRLLAESLEPRRVGRWEEGELRRRLALRRAEEDISLPSLLRQLCFWSRAARLDAAQASQYLAALWHPPTNRKPERNNPWLFQQKRNLGYADDLMLNLLGSALVAIDLVHADTPHRAQLLLFLAHASDVLEEHYRVWLNSHTKPADTQQKPRQTEQRRPVREPVQLSSPLTGLALHVRSVIDRVGKGRLAEVDPGSFMALLEAAHAEPCPLPSDTADFVRVRLPRVLVRWVADAYPGAVAGARPARWLPHVERLLEFYSDVRKSDQDMRRRLESACLQRFLCPALIIPPDDRLDWRTAQKAGIRLEWRLNARQLLITERNLPARDWRPDWPEPDNLQVEIARGLERLAVYERLAEGERQPFEGWRDEWVAPLQQVERDLDRFIRLRLLETLDNPLVSNDQSLVIAQTILEVGSVYELEILFAKVFPANEANTHRYLRQPVVQMAARVLDRLESGFSSARPRAAIEPEEALLLRSRADMLWEMLALVACRSDDGPQIVLNELRGIVRQRTHTRLHVSDAAVDVEDAVVNAGAGGGPACLQRALVIDINESTATIFSDRTAIPAGLFNGLDASNGEWEEFSATASSPRDVLALVVAMEGAQSDPETCCVLNWGGPAYLRLTRRREEVRGLQAGAYVRIAVARAGDGTWVLDRAAGLRSLPRASSPGDIEGVRLDARGLGLAEDPDWNPDTSSIFRPRTAREPDMLARVVDENHLAPVDGSLPELLARLPLVNGEPVAVVALAGAVDEGWRVAIGLGEHYLLHRTAFLPDAARRIDAELENLKNDRGLLIAIRGVLVEGRLRLDLADIIEHEPLLEAYPALKCPFDNRNLQWRDTFERGEAITARREGAQWVADVSPPVPGFPPMIDIEVEGYRPRGTAARLQCTVKSWQPQKPCLRAEAVRTYQVNPSGGDWRGFLQRWIEPRAGQRITLSRLVTPLRDGYALCSTSEDVLVMVEAESLTMRPLSGDLILNERREAEILESRPDAAGAGGRQELEIDGVPQQVLQPPSCRGILTRLPRDRNVDDAVCQIVWDEERPQPVEVTIRNIIASRARIQQGTIVEGSYDGNRWHFVARNLRVWARALWILDGEPAGGDAFGYCLATAGVGGHTRVLAEVGPGRLARLSIDGQAALGHLAVRTGGTWQGGIMGGQRAKADVSRGSFGPPDARYLRVVLDQDRGRLPARCRLGSAYGDVEVVSIRVHVEERPGNMVALRREVETRRSRASDGTTRPRPDEPDPSDLWGAYLARENRQICVGVETVDGELFVRLPEIEAEAEGQTVRGTLQAPTADGGAWTSRVPVAAGKGPFIRHGRYDDDGLAVLVQLQSGAWAASFRAAPGSTATLRAALGAPLDEICSVEDRNCNLYYVGLDESRDGERHHLFEYGYGYVVRAPEGKLRWHSLPFEKAKFVLFNGDQITDVSFTIDPPGRETGATDDPVVSIAGMLVCEGHTLYDQRRKLDLVHLLKIVYTNMEVRVLAIEGFEDRRIKPDSRTFEVAAATLTPDSAARLAPLLPEAQPTSILGRLLEKEYRDTGGRHLRFEHVRLSLGEGEAGAPLRPGERVFLQAGEIVPLEWANEIGLRVRQPEGLRPGDVDHAFSDPGALVLRRQFSVRPELLRRILDDPELGPNTLAGHLLLARITADERGRIRVSLRKPPATRSPDALLTAIRTRPMLAAVASEPASSDSRHPEHNREADESDQPRYVVEIRPAVFVSIPTERLASFPPELEPGSIVRIELCNRAGSTDFRLTLAAFGDGRYVPETGRPVVALPLGPTLRRESSRQAVGDLPGIIAAWTGSADGLAGLMQTPHPKLVTLRREAQECVVTPGVDCSCGRLEVGDSGIRCVPLPGSSAREPQPLSWHLLTFEDASIVEIRKRIDEGRWRYHDRFSGYWLPDGSLRKQQLPNEQTGWTGPVFFEDFPDGLRLRFTPRQFLRFGMPVDALGDMLRRQSSSTATSTFPVAGAADDNGGVWIELAPGRLVEVPGMLVEESHTRQSLRSFDWNACAPGDRLKFRLRRGEAYAVDTFALIDWFPGPRGAFGKRTAYLPIGTVDERRGCVRVGAGEWSLDLPLSDIGEQATLVAVRADNTCLALSTEATRAIRLERGDVVMLTVGEGNEPRIAGWPEVRAQLDATPVDANVDPITRELTTRAGIRLALGGPGYARLVRDLGGAIPLMVTGRTADGRVVYVSTALLVADRLPPDRVVVGRALTTLANGVGVLRIGGRLTTVAVDSIVSGLPPTSAPQAWEALRASGINIWLRCDAEGRVRGGLRSDTRAGLRVSGVASVADERAADSAVIVRSDDSLALYWLPLSRAAWMDIPAERADALLVTRGLADVTIQQQPGRTPCVSVVDHEDARRQLRELSVGDELAVQVVEGIGAAAEDVVRTAIVQSITTRILMELEVEGGPPLVDQVIPVEITRIRKGPSPRVRVVPIGQRRIRLDLPSWMHAAESERLDVSHAQFLEWLTEEYPADLPASGEPGGEAPLDRFLCHAYRKNGPYQDRLRPQYLVAKRWVSDHRAAQELVLPFALMALLTLARIARQPARAEGGAPPETLKEIRELVRELSLELGRRAQRSAHVEVLSDLWLARPPIEGEDDGLWGRLSRLKSSLQGPQSSQNIRTLRRYCEAADLYGSRDHRAIGDAISASLGELRRFWYVQREAWACSALVEVARTVSPRATGPEVLHEKQCRRLEDLMERIAARPAEVTLLRSLRLRRRSEASVPEPPRRSGL